MSKNIAVLPGDGIGPEVIDSALQVLAEVGDFSIMEHPIGAVAIRQHGVVLPGNTEKACQQADAVLLGAVGGSSWESADPEAPTPEQGLLGLRRALGVYANIRPVQPLRSLYLYTPLTMNRIEGVNLAIVRELTGGIYFGEKERSDNEATDVCHYTREEIERVAHVAFQLAEQRLPDKFSYHKVTSVDKANVLETSRLWRQVVTEVAGEYDIEVEHLLVDDAADRLMSEPKQFDIILTENMFGDILSDQAAPLAGSKGMVPSASLGDKGPGLFEPIHGAAPDIAGKGIANPSGTILSAAMALDHIGMSAEAKAIRRAVKKAIEQGIRTKDLHGQATTKETTDAVIENITLE